MENRITSSPKCEVKSANRLSFPASTLPFSKGTIPEEKPGLTLVCNVSPLPFLKFRCGDQLRDKIDGRGCKLKGWCDGMEYLRTA